MKTIRIEGSKIKDWSSFFEEFDKAIGFPAFFDKNMDAWIDCMTNLDEEFNALRIQPGRCYVLR